MPVRIVTGQASSPRAGSRRCVRAVWVATSPQSRDLRRACFPDRGVPSDGEPLRSEHTLRARAEAVRSEASHCHLVGSDWTDRCAALRRHCPRPSRVDFRRADPRAPARNHGAQPQMGETGCRRAESQCRPLIAPKRKVEITAPPGLWGLPRRDPTRGVLEDSPSAPVLTVLTQVDSLLHVRCMQPDG